jgi:hypothetical protein
MTSGVKASLWAALLVAACRCPVLAAVERPAGTSTELCSPNGGCCFATQVPSLHGKTLVEARSELKLHHLKMLPRSRDDNAIVSGSAPAVKEWACKQTPVRAYFSAQAVTCDRDETPMNVRGMPLGEARAALEKCKFVVAEAPLCDGAKPPESWTVARQDFKKNGRQVKLTAFVPPNLPQLVDLTEQRAMEVLRTKGPGLAWQLCKVMPGPNAIGCAPVPTDKPILLWSVRDPMACRIDAVFSQGDPPPPPPPPQGTTTTVFGAGVVGLVSGIVAARHFRRREEDAPLPSRTTPTVDNEKVLRLRVRRDVQG